MKIFAIGCIILFTIGSTFGLNIGRTIRDFVNSYNPFKNYRPHYHENKFLDSTFITCGGFANIACPSNYTCVDDPRDDCSIECGGADCPGICIVSVIENALPCNGFAGFSCNETNNEICIDDNNDGCNSACGGADCGGQCMVLPQKNNDDDDESNYIFCGGIANIACDIAGYECFDDPRDSCSVNCNGADCGGICALRLNTNDTCGGIGNIQCPDGFKCIDDPSDTCNNLCGADCPGICVFLPTDDDIVDNYIRDCVQACVNKKKSCMKLGSGSGWTRKIKFCKNKFKSCIKGCTSI